MKVHTKSNETTAPGFPIGVVCRMIGIAQETLRAWERRYALVTPSRAGGRNRLYSQEDVRRITLVKALVDAGHSIGSVAGLDEEQLELLQQATTAPTLEPRKPAHVVAGAVPAAARVAIVGRALATRLGSAAEQPALSGAAVADSLAEFGPGRLRADVLVLEMPTVHADAVAVLANALGAAGARAAVVVYEFGTRAAVAALEAHGAICLKGPAEPIAIERACTAACASVGASGSVTADAAPARRFSPEQLAAIVARAPTIACECPRHLASLISSLTAFERYSGECESRSPADAHIHRDLQRVAGAARAMIEESLEKVLIFEGVDAEP